MFKPAQGLRELPNQSVLVFSKGEALKRQAPKQSIQTEGEQSCSRNRQNKNNNVLLNIKACEHYQFKYPK